MAHGVAGGQYQTAEYHQAPSRALFNSVFDTGRLHVMVNRMTVISTFDHHLSPAPTRYSGSIADVHRNQQALYDRSLRLNFTLRELTWLQ